VVEPRACRVSVQPVLRTAPHRGGRHDRETPMVLCDCVPPRANASRRQEAVHGRASHRWDRGLPSYAEGRQRTTDSLQGRLWPLCCSPAHAAGVCAAHGSRRVYHRGIGEPGLFWFWGRGVRSCHLVDCRTLPQSSSRLRAVGVKPHQLDVGALMSIEVRSRSIIAEWFKELDPDRRYKPLPPRGAVAAALTILENLKTRFDLDPSAHVTKKKGQIARTGKGAIQRVLAAHGETRVFLKEGGRTNRGNHAIVDSLLKAVAKAQLEHISDADRVAALHAMQAYLVERVSDYFQQERIKVDFDPSNPARTFITSILTEAEKKGRADYVAQHLVGAKLDLRFPNLTIANFAGSAADEQSGRMGDFEVGDTAFHVTISPTPAVCEKCAANLRMGTSPVLLVLDSRLAAARELVRQQGILDKTMVESIESFVGQNMAELSEFRRDRLRKELAQLVAEYNRRVEEVETDISLLIDAPPALELAKNDEEDEAEE